ncbi:MAG: flagellar M-ring protein FliF [Desulfobacteraceae bacterium]|nr:flagellar M-ring protein FliF [Desulfobacteraceae bacterium]
MPTNELSSQLKALFKNLTLAKRFTLIAFVGGTIIGFILLMNWAGSPDFQVLYSNLGPEDAGAIVAELKEKRIPYKISSNGSSILAPSEQIYDLRLELATNSLPRGSGVGFEIFDNAKLGMTEFVQNVNYQRALQGELSRTIDRIDGIESSRIHLVMPSKSLFIEEDTPATASVILKLRSGRWLSKDQVQAIVHLVSSSISGLNPENITIVDNYGKMLSGTKDKSGTGQISSDQLALQEKMEKGLENKIQTMLETALGAGKAIARVSCSLDFKREEKTEELYQPDNKAIRSEQLFSERSGGQESIPSGVPGILSNTQAKESVQDEEDKTLAAGQSPGAVQVQKTETSTGGQSFVKQDRTVNYEISKVTSHIVEPFGRLKSVSVAVIVDGIRKSVVEKDKRAEWKYFPRTDDEMAKLEKIVKRAINFDARRGDSVEVVNLPFEPLMTIEDEEDETAEGWLSGLKDYAPSVKIVSLSIFLLLSFIFVIRPVIRWLTANSAGNERMMTQLPKTLAEIESESGRSMPSRDKALRLLTGNQEERTLDLIRGWMKEDEA